MKANLVDSRSCAQPSSSSITSIADVSAEPKVSGFLHTPQEKNGDGLVLAHGAGADCRSTLLTAIADAFAEAGFTVLRCDLPFRQLRPHGPPFPGTAAKDREGLRRAVAVLQETIPGRIFLGGHSYGGRQATMLAAEREPFLAGLLLLSYPLHPPRKPTQLRVSHFPQLTTPALFVHGSRDPFGSVQEMRSALELIPARNMLWEIAGSGHELLPRKAVSEVSSQIVESFRRFFG